MAQQAEVQEKAEKALNLLRGVVEKNDDLVKESTELARKNKDLERQMTFWRDRCQAIEGIVVPIVGKPLPRSVRPLIVELGRVFINRVNVEEHLKPDAAPAKDDGEDDEEDGGQG